MTDLGATPPPAPHTLYGARQRWLFLGVLFLVSTSNFADRTVISVLLEPIRLEFGVSDTMLGLLSGLAFALLYSALGVPVARWADRGNRRVIVALAVATWSVMCTLCGMAQTFWQLLLARMGVGAREAGATPPS
jgi:predicted MFS family arabinose efflux permease